MALIYVIAPVGALETSSGHDPGGSPATAERLAEGLRDSDIRRGGAPVHHLSDVAVHLAHIDHADSGFCRQVAVIKHCRCLPVVIRGAEQVGAAHPFDIPSSR